MRQALKDRQREIERANELEERSGERKRKFVSCRVGATSKRAVLHSAARSHLLVRREFPSTLHAAAFA